MKKWVKNTITIGLCLIPIGLVVGFSNSWSNKTPISCVGSSAVKPFVEQLAKNYQKDHKKLDITVEAGGSGFGIEQIAKNYANIGDASKDPYSAVKDSFQKEWMDQRIKTVTIGWEAICAVYIPPKNLGLSSDQLNEILTVNEDNIEQFMRIFTGWKDGVHNTNLGDYMSDPTNLDLKAKLDRVPIIPYVRAGGSLTSGTASSFVGNTNLKFDITRLTDRQQAAFKSGFYGTSFGIQQTDEANSRAWDMFSRDNKPGQIVYLSSAFVNQKENYESIQKKGYGIIAYNGHPYNIESVDEQNGYNWFRPLNTMIALKRNNTTAQEFIKYALNHSDDINGCKHLTDDEKDWMFQNNGIDGAWKSDVEIAPSNPWDSTSWLPDKPHFSPLPQGMN